MSPLAASPLIWLDLEMTGLFPDTCVILEIATVVTDSDLNVMGEGPDVVIQHPSEVLEGMNEWCVVQHAESGLTRQVLDSTVSLRDAETMTLEFLRDHTRAGVSPLCGNSISLDWQFLRAHMPELTAFVSDQLLDVTSIKELVRRWSPDSRAPQKAESHRARDDIHESIAELKFYRTQLMRERIG